MYLRVAVAVAVQPQKRLHSWYQETSRSNQMLFGM